MESDMQLQNIFFATSAALITTLGVTTSTSAAITVQIGTSGKTFASAAAQCAMNPATGVISPTVQAGLFNPTQHTEAVVRLNGVKIKELHGATLTSDVWLADGSNALSVALSKKVTDTYVFSVASGLCKPPATAGNFYSADGTLEYAASGKSYLTVAPGCALNPGTGWAQPLLNLFDNGSFLLNVSVNGVPLTQLSALRPRTPVFLSAGQNVITAVNGVLSTDTFVRDGGTGTCSLP
jgi:hypothetical protein